MKPRRRVKPKQGRPCKQRRVKPRPQGLAGRRPGRPCKLTAALQAAICELITAGNMSPSGAGLRLGVAAQTLSGWRKTIPEFSDALACAQGEQQASLLAAVRGGVNGGGLPDWKAAAWLLERLHREEFGTKPAQINVAAGASVSVALQMNPEQLQLLQAARAKALLNVRPLPVVK